MAKTILRCRCSTASSAPNKNASRKTVAAPARKKSTGRKAVAKKTTAKRTTKRTPRAARKEVFGEGNYTAAREFRDQETNFGRRNRQKIESPGEEVKAALEGDEGNEGEELEHAEEEARSHSHSPDEEV